MSDINKYNPNYSLMNMSIDNFIWSIIGIVIGIIVNNFTVFIIKKYNIIDINTQSLIQLLLCCFTLSFIQIHINNYFGWSWQNITPGLFFVSCFFSVQYKLFSNLSLSSIN
jgi:hypothetical protein